MINKLVKEAHKNAVDHGWWEKPKSMGELLALIHSEISEALEEHRNGKNPTETYYSGKIKNPQKQAKYIAFETISYKEPRKDVRTNYGMVTCDKPEGIPSELADVVIRVFDICGYYGIDLEAAIKEKMEYNKSRPYKHGNKKL